ncbi:MULTISPECIES: SIMPL domain-containing protein [Marinobacter]|uniref:SIMPL domain-containing protein n=1 Tax=Marinobacter TaxID=2742 RepID=UPI001D08CBF7|nr:MULTISPECIES: SIMPL domain-containing protein [Marinobacter]MCG8518392.1 SIMPL domain-containing protein [Pseudomonadales bacterium]MCK7566645.1 SIMPL domain-containing protein [Marinobacter xestospongiae]UDL05687.1 SIMPL domain-containing protein [Marinobacter sp. CA1]
MKVITSLIVALGLVASAFLVKEGLTHLRTSDRYVTVKGVAERQVEADLALWPLRFVAAGDTLAAAQEQARSSREAIMAFLKLQAIDTDAVELQRLDVTDNRANPYQGNNNNQRFIINQTLMVRSEDIERVRQAAQAVSELVDSGVVLSADYGPSGPTYLFNGLNDIKPAMIAEATAAAREAARQFAKDANASLGTLRRANQGVFQILARDQAAGVVEAQQAIKTVRVVSTVQYYLD